MGHVNVMIGDDVVIRRLLGEDCWHPWQRWELVTEIWTSFAFKWKLKSQKDKLYPNWKKNYDRVLCILSPIVFNLCRGPASAESRDTLRMNGFGKRMTRGDQASVSEACHFIFRGSFYTLSCTLSKVKNVQSTQHSISINFYWYQVPSCKSLIFYTLSSGPEACWYFMTPFW